VGPASRLGSAVGVLWLRARAQLRGRVGANLFLAVLVGLAAALVLAAAAGARRSEAALPRFLVANQTVDAAVYVPISSRGDDLAEARRQVAALPGVRQVFRASGWTAGALVLAVADPADPTHWHRQLGTVALDPGGSVAFGRPILVAGRLPDERRPDEVAVDEELAARRHLRVGSRVRVGAFTFAQLGPAGEGRDVAPRGMVADLLVAGIVRYPEDLLPVVADQESLLVNSGDLYLTPAWWRRYGPDIANYGIGLAVQLQNGQADLPRLRAGLRRLYGGEAAAEGVDASIGDKAITAGTRRAIALESAALAAFAALTALAALLLVGQTLGRQVVVEGAEFPILRALGMTRGQLVCVAVVRAAPVAMAGAVLAVVGAVALSPATPLGVARRAELDPGIAVDPPVLTVGAAAVVAGVLACAVLAGWRASRVQAGGLGVAEVAGAERPSRVAGALAAAGLPPTAITGTRQALEPGRGRTAVPVRSAITAAAAAVIALTLAAVFGASLLRLVRDPAAYGVTWDVRVGNLIDPRAAELAAGRLADDPAVAAYRGLVTGVGSFVDGRSVPLLSFSPGKGSLGPAVVEGREPIRPDEVALGATTMRTLGKRIGDTVEVSGVGEPQRLRVVGRVIVNQGDPGAVVAPGKGAIVHVDVWRRISPSGMPIVPSSFFVRLDPAADRRQAVQRLQRDFPNTVVFPLKQPDLIDLEHVGYLPGLLAGLVALLALGTVTHALVTSVRRRRRDLAMLKTLGFTRGQVSQTVAWQATTFALVAALAGLPVGIAAGRWAWRLVADQLGVVSGPVVPPVPALAIVAGALLAANLAAAGPGWVAARVRPATVLRTE
jgi:MacB-like periplasmic core domain/FtsX-like permease family